MNYHFEYNGPAHQAHADGIEALTEVVTQVVGDISCGHRHVIVTHQAQYHRMLALVDSLGWTDSVTVMMSPQVEINMLMIIPEPPGFARPKAPGKHRYGMRRCSHCAAKLRWFELPGVELCRDCRPSLRDQTLPSGRVIRAGSPGPGRGFRRGSRWDEPKETATDAP